MNKSPGNCYDMSYFHVYISHILKFSPLREINNCYNFLCYFRPEALFFLVLYALYCVFMAFSSKIENAIGDKIPVPQSWREVQQVIS